MTSSPASDESFTHGIGGYTNHKCDCTVCTTEWNAYMVLYRREHGVRINARRRARRRLARGEGPIEKLLAEEFKRGGLDTGS